MTKEVVVDMQVIGVALRFHAVIAHELQDVIVYLNIWTYELGATLGSPPADPIKRVADLVIPDNDGSAHPLDGRSE